MKNAKHRYHAEHQILDPKKLTDEGNKSFQHNKAKTTLFSKCRTVFVISNYPTEMILSYLNPKTMQTDRDCSPGR